MNTKKPNTDQGGQDSQNPHNAEDAGRSLLRSLEPSLWNSKIGRRAFVKRTGAATVGTAIALHGFRMEVMASFSRDGNVLWLPDYATLSIWGDLAYPAAPLPENITSSTPTKATEGEAVMAALQQAGEMVGSTIGVVFHQAEMETYHWVGLWTINGQTDPEHPDNQLKIETKNYGPAYVSDPPQSERWVARITGTATDALFYYNMYDPGWS